jgi:hypothetical protein
MTQTLMPFAPQNKVAANKRGLHESEKVNHLGLTIL